MLNVLLMRYPLLSLSLLASFIFLVFLFKKSIQLKKNLNMMTLGILNNNPCNIRYNSANKWKGQVGSLKGFSRFKCMEYGLRAALSLLRTYRYQYGLDTVRKIITRFAPPSENDTEAYISHVVSFLHESGVYYTADSHLFLDFYDYKGDTPLFYLLKAICYIESRFDLTPDLFERSLKLL